MSKTLIARIAPYALAGTLGIACEGPKVTLSLPTSSRDSRDRDDDFDEDAVIPCGPMDDCPPQAPYCSRGECVECRNDDDCNPGQKCELDDRECDDMKSSR